MKLISRATNVIRGSISSVQPVHRNSNRNGWSIVCDSMAFRTSSSIHLNGSIVLSVISLSAPLLCWWQNSCTLMPFTAAAEAATSLWYCGFWLLLSISLNMASSISTKRCNRWSPTPSWSFNLNSNQVSVGFLSSVSSSIYFCLKNLRRCRMSLVRSVKEGLKKYEQIWKEYLYFNHIRQCYKLYNTVLGLWLDFLYKPLQIIFN